MTTTIGVGLDDHRQGYECGRRAARAALTELTSTSAVPVDLALLFTSHPQPEQVLKGVHEVLGSVALVGATSAGQYSQQGYVEEGTGIMLISSDHIQFHPLSHTRRLFRDGKLLGKLSGTAEDGLGSRNNHRALMLFPDDTSMNLDSVVDKAMTETAMLYDILGGPGPTLPAPPRAPALFFNERVLRAGLSGVEMLSQQPFGLALANGWTSASGPYRVTRTGEHRLLSIDGRPAREVYEDFLLPLDKALSREMLMQYPVGICQKGDCKVSMIRGMDGSGALQLASPPPVGSLIHILRTEADAMITAARRAIEQAFQNLPNVAPAGLLFIDCLSTAMILGEAYSRQQEVVHQALGDVPFLGFRSHGVLARLEGQTSGHFECSVATCLLPD